MIKYYLAATIGSGTENDPYRPKVADYSYNWTAIYEIPEAKNSIVAVKDTEEIIAQIETDEEILLLADNLNNLIINEEYQRICPSGTVMVYA